MYQFFFVLSFLSTYHGIFYEVYINFLIFDHMHNDFDLFFSRLRSKLRGIEYPILPLLMKSCMDIGSQSIILHLIEEVSDFKKFVESYLCIRHDAPEDHTSS